MKLTKILFQLLCFTSLVFVFSCKKNGTEEEKPTYSVKGWVFNEFNRPLGGAEVIIIGNNITQTVKSADDGSYIINNLVVGTYTLSAKKENFIESSVKVEIKSGENIAGNIILKSGTTIFKILSDSIYVKSAPGGVFAIEIESNTTWAVDNQNAWLSFNKLSGTGISSIAMTILANTSDSARNCVFFLRAGSIQKRFEVRQLAKIAIMKVYPIPGNQEKNISDSIAVVFNQAVKIKQITPSTSSCLTNIGYNYEDRNRVVKYSYACAKLGGTYPFAISAEDSLGTVTINNFDANFYSAIVNVPGYIRSTLISDSDNSLWVMTTEPSAIHKIDIATMNVLQTYKFEDEIVMFTVSPYNNKIYLAFRAQPVLHVLNQDGTTFQTINISKDSARHWAFDYVCPMNISFAKNGIGIVFLTEVRGGGYSAAWFIDATDNNRIFYERFPGLDPVITEKFNDVNVNYDKTKFIMSGRDNDHTVYMFDSEKKIWSVHRALRPTVGAFNKGSRKNANIYMGQLYNQMIINPETGFQSGESFIDNRPAGMADFSYRNGRDLTVYFYDESSIQVLDYNTLSTPLRYRMISNCRDITTTLDGNHVLVYTGGQIIRLQGSWFDY